MINRFVEFTGTDGTKIFINPFYIVSFQNHPQIVGSGQVITTNAIINVKHTYMEIQKLLGQGEQ